MDQIERLAREYRTALETAADGSAFDRIVVLEENQLDYVSSLLARAPLSPLDRRTLSYVKNILYRILRDLNVLLKNNGYVPSFRSAAAPCSSLLAAIKNTQISIYVLYDESDRPYADIAALLELENRKTGLVASL